MKHHTSSDQRGVGHVGLFVGIIVIVLVVGAGYYVYKKHKDATPSASVAVQQALKNVKCEEADKDICKFFAAFKVNDSYTVASSTKSAGGNSDSTIITSGSNSHVKFSGSLNYETIVIGETIYTKASDGTWWKQTVPKTDVSKYTSNTTSDLVDPNAPTPDAPKVTYKKITKESCGKYTCFKYQVIDPAQADTTQYIWFDNSTYQLRRMQTVSKDATYDATFNYDKVTVTAPTPSKDLGPDQFLVPGQSTPVTVPTPSAGASGGVGGTGLTQEQIDALIQQYSNPQ